MPRSTTPTPFSISQSPCPAPEMSVMRPGAAFGSFGGTGGPGIVVAAVKPSVRRVVSLLTLAVGQLGRAATPRRRTPLILASELTEHSGSQLEQVGAFGKQH